MNIIKKISERNYNPNRLSLNSIDDNRYTLKHRHSTGGNDMFNFLKKKTQEMQIEISPPEYESDGGEDDENINKLLNSSPKLKSALKNNESEKKKKS